MSEVTSKLLIDQDGAPLDRIVGFETEYAALGRRRLSCVYSDIPNSVMRNALEIERSSQFRPSGERIYLDIGDHPELSTAEDVSFQDASNRLLAGHFTMARLCSKIADQSKDYEDPIDSVRLASNTVDGRGNTWASHENYLARRDLTPSEYIGTLATHHASRIVWSGAGNILTDDRGKNFAFTLSEKAEHMYEIANGNTTACRALVNLRDEALASSERFRRIHIICGESVFSGFTNALRLASGSLVLRACELGVSFDDLQPANPVKAMKQISRDPTLKTAVELVDGRRMTGLNLQLAIAERTLKALDISDYVTDQERQWGGEWIRVCDDLGTDPNQCLDRLDWVMKRRLIDREIAGKSEDEPSDDAKPEPVGKIAQSKSFHYHQLLPEEGVGMKLVRKGRFEGTYSEDVLESGLPLPPTRAKARGEAVGRLEKASERDFTADWHIIGIEVWAGYRRFKLNNPYQTEHEGLTKYLDTLK